MGLSSPWGDRRMEMDSPRELVNIQASHAETVLELEKTRNLLLVEHRISKDLQVYTHIDICQSHKDTSKLFHSTIILSYTTIILKTTIN